MRELEFDGIIIGAGPNGLTTAGYLTKAGQMVRYYGYYSNVSRGKRLIDKNLLFTVRSIGGVFSGVKG